MTYTIEICVIGKRCVYINDFRVAGGKPYVSENLPQHSFHVRAQDIFEAFSADQIKAELKRREPPMTNPKHTDTSRSGDLVERLRSPGAVFYEYGADKGALLHSCADRIEALEAEIKRLLARLAHAEDDCEDDCIYCEERRQEIARAALGEKQ